MLYSHYANLHIQHINAKYSIETVVFNIKCIAEFGIVSKNHVLKNVEKIRGIIVRGKEVQIERNIAQNAILSMRH